MTNDGDGDDDDDDDDDGDDDDDDDDDGDDDDGNDDDKLPGSLPVFPPVGRQFIRIPGLTKMNERKFRVATPDRRRIDVDGHLCRLLAELDLCWEKLLSSELEREAPACKGVHALPQRVGVQLLHAALCNPTGLLNLRA